jgi:LysR family nitrogen assimilation transcriptional regulator
VRVVDTHRLRYFLRIAEDGSMSHAARVLGVAQPALSRQVRLLEEELGVTLFRRTSRGVQLTEEGERLRATTAAPLRQLERAMQYVSSPLARVERGLHIGVPETASDVFSAPLLFCLGAAFPRVSFSISVAHTDHLVERMLKGAVDVAVINPVPDDRLFCGDLLTEELVLVGGPDSGLRPGRPVEFTGLAELPLILPSSKTGIGNNLENTALRLKVKLQSRFATDSVQVAKNLMAAGRCYAVLPLAACGPEIETGRLRYAPLIEPTPSQQLVIAVTSHLGLPTGFASKVCELVGDEAARLIDSGAWPAQLTVPHPK